MSYDSIWKSIDGNNCVCGQKKMVKFVVLLLLNTVWVCKHWRDSYMQYMNCISYEHEKCLARQIVNNENVYFCMLKF